MTFSPKSSATKSEQTGAAHSIAEQVASDNTDAPAGGHQTLPECPVFSSGGRMHVPYGAAWVRLCCA